MKYIRLKKNTDFQKMFKRGKRVFSPCITLLYYPDKKITMGIAVSKKHGKAVQRNRIKRLLRAVFDANCEKLSKSYSIVILPKVSESYDYKSFEQSLIKCINKINKCEN